jgi:hypothetical protein
MNTASPSGGATLTPPAAAVTSMSDVELEARAVALGKAKCAAAVAANPWAFTEPVDPAYWIKMARRDLRKAVYVLAAAEDALRAEEGAR